jgi:hypothetical protein
MPLFGIRFFSIPRSGSDFRHSASSQFRRAPPPARIVAMKLSATSSAQRRGGESGAPVKEMVMNVSDKGLNAIQDNIGQSSGEPRKPRLQIIAAVVGLAVLLVGGAQWSQRDAVTAQEAAPQLKAEAQVEPTTFDYFPAQYVNQGKEVEEHIQAF